jgi:SAM-dependent methyltransferase
VRRLRWWAGRVYAAGWRRARGLLARATPRSERGVPLLPAEPFSRSFGLDHGTPIDRVHIEAFLERHRADVRGAVLEILEPVYTERFGAGVTRSEVLDAAADAPRATIRGNLETGENLPAGAFDCFICTQTFSYTLDVQAAVRNAARVLKPGGVLLCSVPGISQQRAAGAKEQEFPDLYRFTSHALRRLLEAEFAEVEVEAFGDVRSAAQFLYGIPAERAGAPAAHDPDYELVLCARARSAGVPMSSTG